MKLLAVYTFFRFCQARKACFAEKWLKIIRMSVKRKSFGAIFVENRESLRPAVGELEQAAEKLAPRKARHALAREQRKRCDRRAVCVENVERAERLALLNGRINALGQRDGLRQAVCTALFEKQGVFARQNALHRLLRAERHGHGGQRSFGSDGDERIRRKAVIQKRFGIGKALVARAAAQDDRDELHAVLLRGRADAVFGRIGRAGLEPRRAGVKAHELVGVDEHGRPAAQRVHPDRRKAADVGVVPNELARHERDVVGRGDMPVRGQARAVDKVRVVHAELLGSLVHARDKRFLAACQVLAERDGRVVAGDDAHGLDEVLDAHLLALFEPDLAAAHRCGVRAACDGVVIRKRAGVDGLHG